LLRSRPRRRWAGDGVLRTARGAVLNGPRHTGRVRAVAAPRDVARASPRVMSFTLVREGESVERILLRRRAEDVVAEVAVHQEAEAVGSTEAVADDGQRRGPEVSADVDAVVGLQVNVGL